MKFETVRIYFFSEFSVCYHPKRLLPWQSGVTTSPLYSLAKTAISPLPSPLRMFRQIGPSTPQRHKFHTDEVKLVRNLVKSSDWST